MSLASELNDRVDESFSRSKEESQTRRVLRNKGWKRDKTPFIFSKKEHTIETHEDGSITHSKGKDSKKIPKHEVSDYLSKKLD